MARDLFAERGITPTKTPRDLFAERGIAPTIQAGKNNTDFLSSAPVRFAYGLAEPMIGAGQLLAKGISAGEEKGTFLGDLGDTVTDYWKGKDTEQLQANKEANVGTNVAGFAGNVLSPANALIASKGIGAASTLGKIGEGALLGSVSGATQPAYSDNFVGEKALQAGVGAVAGGAMTGLINKAASAFNSKALRSALPEDAGQLSGRAEQLTDEAIDKAVSDIGIKRDELPNELLQQIRDEMLNGLKNGKELDAAALLRKKDFEALGVPPLTGQITRDSATFSREKNLRGAIPEVANIFNEQQKILLDGVYRFGGKDASEKFQAGETLIAPLKGILDEQKAIQNNLYSNARDEAGRYAQVNTKQFSDNANNALDELNLGYYLPAESRRLLNDISRGKIPLTVNNLVQVDSVLSSAQRTATRKGEGNSAKAIGLVRDALNSADIEDSAGSAAKSAFDTARNTAREHFKLREANPALKEIVNGKELPDTFVSRFIINEKSSRKVKNLMELLPDEAKKEARSQIGNELKKAAYGLTGESLRPAGLKKALDRIGTEKLSAFYTPEEIADLQRISRVSQYITVDPAGAWVNHSNSGVALIAETPLIKSLLGAGVDMLPGGRAVVNIAGSALKAGVGAVKNNMTASESIAAKVPVKNSALSEEQRRGLSKLLGFSAAGGAAAGSQILE